MLELILQSLALKDETRTGWLLRGVSLPESVADHSWGTAFLCLLYAREASVDSGPAVSMALVHDLAEAVTGDVATRVAAMNDPKVTADKRMRETEGMNKLLSGVETEAADTIRALWEEYEENTSATARFVRDMNLIDMCAQAFRYEEAGRYDAEAPNPHFPNFAGMDEFFATTRPRLSTSIGRELFDAPQLRYAGLTHVRERGGPRLSHDSE